MQGAQRSAASQPVPSQQPQTAGAAGASRPAPDTMVAAACSTPPGAGPNFGAMPEDPSDDSGWETASEESAEFNADEAAGSESAAKKQKVTAGGSSKEHSKGIEGAEKQHADSAVPAGNQVSVLSSFSSRTCGGEYQKVHAFLGHMNTVHVINLALWQNSMDPPQKASIYLSKHEPVLPL